MTHFSTTFIVQGALGILALFSVLTWALILGKGVQNWRLWRQDEHFARHFWRSPSIAAAGALTDGRGPKSRLLGVTVSSLRGDAHNAAHDLEHSWDRQELLERQLRRQLQIERQYRESGLAILASVGSTAPFVGLFGTVFGIIHALSAISKSASASIDVVAGPIGEALIATGVGIAVAIPAVLAYNFLIRRVKTRSADLESYATDLVNLAQKNGFRIIDDAPAIGLVPEPTRSSRKEVFA
ncbi:MotA/TolQ/ExbB proton channel family protein [Caballeronia sp. DA-9]|uniref:MotA/TolQ/ExbB proton channel family protein n=1 Tax=Caballeronia sp. DA-9 TaxID=3436237 RepID=UPI003F661B9F